MHVSDGCLWEKVLEGVGVAGQKKSHLFTKLFCSDLLFTVCICHFKNALFLFLKSKEQGYGEEQMFLRYVSMTSW